MKKFLNLQFGLLLGVAGCLCVAAYLPTPVPVIWGGTGLTNTGAAGQVLTSTGSSLAYSNISGVGGGTVTSVAMTVPSLLSVSGSPITSAGTLAVTMGSGILASTNGGTGFNTYDTGEIVVGNVGGTLDRLGIGVAGKVLTSTGTSLAYSNVQIASVLGTAASQTIGAGTDYTLTNDIFRRVVFGTTSVDAALPTLGTWVVWCRITFQSPTTWDQGFRLYNVTQAAVVAGSDGTITSVGTARYNLFLQVHVTTTGAETIQLYGKTEDPVYNANLVIATNTVMGYFRVK